MGESGADLGAGVAYIDGEFCPVGEAKISIFDLGFLLGDATYDAVHVWKGSFFRLDDHLERFERSLAGLRLELPHDRADIARIVTECVRRSGLREALIEVIATRGVPPDGRRDLRTCENRFMAFAVPFVWIVPQELAASGANVVISAVPRIPADSVDPTIKNFNRLDFSRALFEAYDRGGEYAVLCDREGNVTEGLGYNIFAVHGGRLISPGGGVLEGVTRRTVFELCAETNVKAELGDIKAEQLRGADEVFLATTAGGVVPVASVDGRDIGDGRPGPLTTRLSELYWAAHDDPRYTTPVDYG
jgi:branched-chain amino acid aminotransferase